MVVVARGLQDQAPKVGFGGICADGYSPLNRVDAVW